ncbi:major histocompatibility complex class I-related gene protein-like [Thunnus thynnus]|uniref:major histocompatibility complex class I-related gene protein-like n=1 Tax=Thunnus thynnus TaxID=8237 RepID=UPI003528F408
MILVVYFGPTFPLNGRRRTAKLKRRLVCPLQSQQDCPKNDAMKTMELVFLLIFFSFTHSVKHSLTYFLTGSSGLQTFPEFVAVSMVDEVQAGYCDSNIKRAEFKHDWMEKLVEDDPHHSEWHIGYCNAFHLELKAELVNLKQHFNQTGGVHILQYMAGCEWDDETEEVTGFYQIGYDGEDFLVFDLKTLTWVASKPQAVIIEHEWNGDKARSDIFFTNTCPQWLKTYLDYEKNSLMRTELPSVSLLQKTPSSPVSCHATGFYPHRAEMFWRKDGEEFHEDVECEEILPNHDGSFQMSVDLDLSSVTPEDWRRYECVFHLSGVKDDIVTKLDKAVIRTNWGKTGILTLQFSPSEFPAGPVIAGVVGLLLLLAVCITGVFIWRRRDNASDSSSSDPSSVKDSALN